MGMLKKSDNTVSRRQEIGRGLRLAVDQHGERMDNPVDRARHQRADGRHRRVVHRLRRRAAEGDRRVACRPPAQGERQVLHRQDVHAPRPARASSTSQSASALYKYLVKNDYINDDDTISDAYKEARDAGTLAEPTSEVLKPVVDFVWPLVDALYLDVPAARRRPQAEADPAQRGELRKEGVPGTVEPDQPQGRLPGRVRLRPS